LVSRLGKNYYRVLTGVFLVALVITMAARILLFTQFTDYATGFYTRESGVVTVYNIVYFGAALFLFIASRLKKTGGDYPLPRKSKLTGVLAFLTGAAIAAYAIVGESFPFIEQNLSPTLATVRGIATMVLGLIAALSFLLFGLAELSPSARAPLHRLNWAPAVLAAVWQVFLLVTRYNSYTTLTTIADNMLTVMFMVFATLFLLGHARTSFGFSRKDGRNYVIPAGFSAGMTGLLLVIPNYIAMVRDATLTPPALTLGLFESVYILFLSVYAIVYTLGVVRSIEQV
jgi:hypothetical protein